MLLVALLLLVATSAHGGLRACVESEPGTLAMFSSKTAYELVHDRNSSSQENVPGCKPVQFWHLMRHGTRYPSEDEVILLESRIPYIQKEVRKNYNAKRVELCDADVERILAWKWSVLPAQGNMLTSQGQIDLHNIGKRYRERFPTLLKASGDVLDDFVFRHTASERTEQSALWYIKGMFGDVKVDLPKPIEKDPLLRFYEMCPAWTTGVNKNATVRRPIVEFQTSDIMTEAVDRVSKRLGFEETLSYDDVDLLWEACRYDRAWKPTATPSENAPWCAAFHKDDLQVFEYRADIKYYYMNAYGNEMNLRLGCPLVKDLVDKFSSLVETGAGPTGLMYFTHTTAVQMTLARLGVGKDPEPLCTANFERMKNDRRWKVSQLGPFASNVAAVLYKCDADSAQDRFKIRLLVNEKPLRVEGCPGDSDLCPWKDFKSNFADIASKCSLDFCTKDDEDTTTPPPPSRATALQTCSLPTLMIFLVLALFRLHAEP